MKRRIFGIGLILLLVLAMLPLQVLAAGTTYSWTGTWKTNYGQLILVQTGSDVTGTYEYDDGIIVGTVSGNTLTGTWSESPSYTAPDDAGDIVFVMTDDGKGFDGQWRYGSEGAWGDWNGGTRLTEVVPISIPDYTNSTWATEELQKANDMGLIPDVLLTADLTKPITRLEFAAVCVKVYENLAATKAIPAVVNPFTDTADIEVLKAYNVGLTDGIGTGLFGPSVMLNREQAAVMLTRVFKRVAIPGWTLATDKNYTLNYTKPSLFADDKDISDWAKASVYFMAANTIIGGVGNNTFAPKAVTSQQEAENYASATREQAIIIAVRMAEKLKGQAADYTKN